MVIQIQMELEGVTDVRPVGDDFDYMFTISCTSCRETHPKPITISQLDTAEMSGSRGTAHFVWRCGHCKKEHSASFIPPTPKSKSTSPLAYASDTPTFHPLIALDCRGLEITAYHYTGRWACVGAESGTPFEFDLDEIKAEGGDEGRWDDYDEKQGEAVGVSEMQSRVVRI